MTKSKVYACGAAAKTVFDQSMATRCGLAGSTLTDSGAPGPYATSHGLPYAYDIHVPILIAGPGIRPGVWADPVSPADIAPTLCALLGVELPSACDGTILRSALR